MAGLSQMHPRDTATAARAVFTLAAVASAVTVVSAIAPRVGNASPGALLLMLPVLAALLLAAWSLRFVNDSRHIGWTLLPLLSVVLIVVLDISTADSTVAAQVFFFFPALYGASQLPRRGAALLTAACVLGEMIVMFRLLSARTAVADCVYVCAVIIAASYLLERLSSDNNELLTQLRRQAAVDPLTGLATRRVLVSAAGAALTSSVVDSGTALLLLDVDNFKTINDEYGHPAGDAVLVRLADILRSECRSEDLVSRLGGDELAVLIVGISTSAAFDRAESIRRRIDQTRFSIRAGLEVNVSVSVGVAHAPTDARDLPALYRAADEALYAAKRAGRNRVEAQDWRAA